MRKVPSYTRAQDYQVDDPCYDIGGAAPQIGIKVKDPTWGISRTTGGVISTFGGIHKKCKIQVSTIYPQCNPLYQ